MKCRFLMKGGDLWAVCLYFNVPLWAFTSALCPRGERTVRYLLFILDQRGTGSGPVWQATPPIKNVMRIQNFSHVHFYCRFGFGEILSFIVFSYQWGKMKEAQLRTLRTRLGMSSVGSPASLWGHHLWPRRQRIKTTEPLEATWGVLSRGSFCSSLPWKTSWNNKKQL